jgi:hypothetical protein
LKSLRVGSGWASLFGKDGAVRVDVAVERLLEERLFVRIKVLHLSSVLKLRRSKFRSDFGQVVAEGSPWGRSP